MTPTSKDLSPQAQAEIATSGPWRFSFDADGDHAIFAGNTLIAVTVGIPDLPRDVDEANARLIAVAPELLYLVLAHDQHGYCPNCGCDLWNTKGCPTCPLMRIGRDILVKLNMAKPRQYAEWSEPDEINNRNLAKAKAEKQP